MTNCLFLSMPLSILIFISICLFISPVSSALTQMNLAVKAIKGATWRLQNASVGVSNIGNQTPMLVLQADRLELPKPFDKLHLINVRCVDIEWQPQQLHCRNGSVLLKMDGLALKPFKFNFSITAKQSSLTVANLSFAKGRLSLKAIEQAGQWQLAIDANKIALADLQSLIQQPAFKVKNGSVTAQLKLAGKQVAVGNAALKMQLEEMTLQSASGQYAAENADMKVYVNAQPQHDTWGWQSHTVFKKGALYGDPIYLKAPVLGIEMDGVGQWTPAQQQLQIDYMQYLHPNVATVNGAATLSLAQKKPVAAAQLNLNALDLKQLTTLYNSPFWVGTAFENVTLAGRLQAKFSLIGQALTALQLDFGQVDLQDPKQRFGLTQAKGVLSWAKQADFNQNAYVQWQQLQVYALPLGKAKLDLKVKSNAVTLLKPVQISLLGGNFDVNQFVWQARPLQSPELHFTGALQKVSLPQLTKALNLTPLAGTLSGTIPGVRYQNNRLDLDGALTVQVFDGEMTIQKLAVANLLSDVPKFYGDIAIERLNLQQLTGQFKFGSIEGLLSGFVRDLYLENWQPVSFYAWLGTPENDDTKHRISQKAVDNIANIGGNGATDLISRSVLGVFDAFGYDQLGLGCYLNAGVCQLMGVAPAKNGYYIVKGGGLPRIDVLGYNPRVDWAVLMQRLERIGKPSDMVVK